MINTACTRYAEALVNIALENGAGDKYGDDLALFVRLLEENEELLSFLQNKMVGREAKKALLKELLEGRIDKAVLSFTFLLSDKERIAQAGGILSEYKRLHSEHNHVLDLTIYSAQELSKEQTDRIKEKYARKYSVSEIKTDVKVDKKLLGGIKIKAGSRVEDASVRSRLEELKKLFDSQE